MANSNPIKVNTPDEETEYDIGKSHANDEITLTIKIDLDIPGWNYQANCQIFLGSKDLYPKCTPEPSALPLGKGSYLSGKKLLICTNVAKIYPPGGATDNPSASYSLIFKANGEVLDTFEAHDQKTTSADFNALLSIK